MGEGPGRLYACRLIRKGCARLPDIANQALPENTTPFWINVVVYTVLGIAVLKCSRTGRNESVRAGWCGFVFAPVPCAVRFTVMARGAVVDRADEREEDDDGENDGRNAGIVEERVASGVRRRCHARDPSRGKFNGKVKKWSAPLSSWQFVP